MKLDSEEGIIAAALDQAELDDANEHVSGVFSSEANDCVRRNWAIFLAELGIKTGNQADMAWSVRLACVNEDVAKTAPPGVCASPVAASAAPQQASLLTERCAAWAPIIAEHTRLGLAAVGDEIAARQACRS